MGNALAWIRVVEAFAGRSGDDGPGWGLCDVAAAVTAVDGAGLVILDADGGPVDLLCSSNHLVHAVEQLCFVIGEGPGLDAHRGGRPVLEPNLAGSSGSRWPIFSPAAVQAGAVAIFAFPLTMGGANLGSLTLYQDHPGDLSDVQFADALVAADISTGRILSAQLGEGRNIDEDNVRLYEPQVHQAVGMVSVQLDVDLAEALVRLRATAYSEEVGLDDVARQIVERRRSLER